MSSTVFFQFHLISSRIELLSCLYFHFRKFVRKVLIVAVYVSACREKTVILRSLIFTLVDTWFPFDQILDQLVVIIMINQ